MSDLEDFVKRGQAAQAAVDKLGAGKPRHVKTEELLAALKGMVKMVTDWDPRYLDVDEQATYDTAVALIARLESERSE